MSIDPFRFDFDEPRPAQGPDEPEPEPVVPRLFLREPGWRIGLKVGSDRTFCYMVAPGQDHYHRLMDGELFLHRGDERLCLPCAARRGLLAFAPKNLREPVIPIEEFDIEVNSDYEVREI
jgi:hypothetical protein